MSEQSQCEDHEAVPDCLTIEEAARILRIGRTAAYSLDRQWRDTDGKIARHGGGPGAPLVR